MATEGRRERKKAVTRRLIAETAARLFAERGYENVAVSDVAREADVSEQTVYNHFGTKEQLVLDRDQHVQERLVELIRNRKAGVSPAAAVRDYVLAGLESIPKIPPDVWRGELGYLAFISPTVHRLSLEMTARQAEAVAAAIADTSPVSREVAALQGMALAGVFQIIITHAGRRTSEGASQRKIANELQLIVESLLDELERWFAIAKSK